MVISESIVVGCFVSEAMRVLEDRETRLCMQLLIVGNARREREAGQSSVWHWKSDGSQSAALPVSQVECSITVCRTTTAILGHKQTVTAITYYHTCEP
eukprot:m.40097 g.40097  ORF g.40097 m.40097 type:complete len:98 (+) comp10398_c0_seq1:1763-2056(+)